MNEEHNKYGTAEFIIGGFFFFGTDVLCAILDTTGVGVIIAPVIQSFGTLGQTYWARSKGDKNAVKLARQLAKYASNALPWMPTLTVMFFIEALMHNHPKLAKAATGKIAAGGAAKAPLGGSRTI